MQQRSLFGDTPPPRPRPGDPIFFGLRPPVAARAIIDRTGRTLKATNALKGRPRPVDTLHLSLHGLARSVDEAAWVIIDACRAVRDVTTPSFRVRFDRITSFKGAALRPLVLLPDETSKAAIVQLWRDVGRALHLAALPAAAKIEPHITLIWTPAVVPEQTISPVSWTVEAFDLIWSHYGQSRHSLLQHIPLPATLPGRNDPEAPFRRP